MWFVEGYVSKIGRITPEGVITEYPVPTGDDPEGITVGPDGNLWFTDFFGGKIGVISTSGQVLHEYKVPPLSGPGDTNELWGITVGSDNNMYFASGDGYIGEITPSGSMTDISDSRHDSSDFRTDAVCACHHQRTGWQYLVYSDETVIASMF